MRVFRISHRLSGLLGAIAAALILGTALATEKFGGVVPCALCLVERWPYRVAIGLGVLAALLPRRGGGQLALWLLLLTFLASAGLGVVHVGVEQGAWPSPLPECAAPHITGTTRAQLLASMPLVPSKPCDAPTYLLPGVPLSMAGMNLLASLILAGFIALTLPGPRARRVHRR